jgi:hypothetical protein
VKNVKIWLVIKNKVNGEIMTHCQEVILKKLSLKKSMSVAVDLMTSHIGKCRKCGANPCKGIPSSSTYFGDCVKCIEAHSNLSTKAREDLAKDIKNPANKVNANEVNWAEKILNSEKYKKESELRNV